MNMQKTPNQIKIQEAEQCFSTARGKAMPKFKKTKCGGAAQHQICCVSLDIFETWFIALLHEIVSRG